jgi:hypothetical protein
MRNRLLFYRGTNLFNIGNIFFIQEEIGERKQLPDVAANESD